MQFRVLGPVQVWADGRELTIPGAQRRALVARLLLQANRVVPAEELARLLWESRPPKTARTALQVQVSGLRRLLAGAAGGKVAAAARLTFHPPGYLLRVGPGELDLDEFRRLADQGRQALAAGEPARAAELLRTALGLWRGRALEDVDAHALATRREQLEDRRLAALEDRIEAELRCGLHDDLVAELTELVEGGATGLLSARPPRERLWGQLMLALYRSGRQADALAAYHQLRERLIEQLGVEPRRPLQQLHRQMLAADPALDGAEPVAGRGSAAPLPPRQLPPDVASFTGREPELEQLELLLGRAGERATTVVGAIDGAAGIGKSALALHAAHRLAERYPGGQLYVDLQGSTPGSAPLHPLEALGRLLRALGIDSGHAPAELDEASAWFRAQLAGRRLLIVLDNARDAAQVRPLLPGDPGCAVLVTSRRVLTELEGARHLHLDVLSPGEATELLARVAGEGRVGAEPEAASKVARLCGRLPLALRIAAARLAARPAWPVRALARRLADQERRLDELELVETRVRASLAVSYHDLRASADPLDRAATAAFPLLGLLEGPDVSVAAAARLLDRPEGPAERVMERLVDARLVETTVPGRYRMHDLLRLYAREHAGQLLSGAERAAALHRVLGMYVATAWRTLALLRPGERRLTLADGRWTAGALPLGDATAALEWLEAERCNLVAGVAQAAAAPGVPDEMALQLSGALYGFFLVRNHLQDWEQVNRTAVAVAVRAGDAGAEALAHNDLGVLCNRLGRYQEALGHLRQSLAIFERGGDRHGQGGTLNNLGNVYEWLGRYDDALDCLRQSLAIQLELGDRRRQSACLTNLGLVHERLGQYDDALAFHRQSLAIDRELGDLHGEAACLTNLGLVHERLGQYDDALDCLQRSLAMFRALGDAYGQAESLADLGLVYERGQHHDQALICLRESLRIRRELGDLRGQADTLRDLGVTLRALGRHQEARTQWLESLSIFEDLRTPAADEVRELLASARVS